MQDWLTEIALEFADAGEQALFSWNRSALCFGEVEGQVFCIYVRAFLGEIP